MVLDIPANIVTGVKQGFDILVQITILLIVANVIGVAIGKIGVGIPFFSLTGPNQLVDHIVGFPTCKSSVGPIEACLLPSRDLVFSIPDSFTRFGDALKPVADKTPAQAAADGDTNVGFVFIFLLDFFGVIVAFISLPFLIAKVLVTLKVIEKGQAFYANYAPNRPL